MSAVETTGNREPIKRVLTGMRTTGDLHLGHYVGALKNWVSIQQGGKHESFFLLADGQAMTTHADNPSQLVRSVRAATLDWMSVGLDPDNPNTHFVLQSQVPERYELSALLMLEAKYAEVMRNPTLKVELKDLEKGSKPTLAFMAYPVDQVADISMVSPMPPQDGDEVLVPVGEDQKPHLEYSRDLAQRINHKYGRLLVPCEPLIGEVGRLVGTDGEAKMSKSKGNAINLSDSPKEVAATVRRMKPAPRDSMYEPGDPDQTVLFTYLRVFDQDKAHLADLEEMYRAGGLGDGIVKQELTKVLNDLLDPIRERRIAAEKRDIREILVAGTEAARAACRPVVGALREAMYLTYPS